MNGTCGIDATVWPALSGLNSFFVSNPGRCPGLAWLCPVGAQDRAISQAPTGRSNPSLGQRPRFQATPPIPAPTGRPHPRSKAPTGRSNPSPGQRPGFVARPNTGALKGRPNRNGGAA
jgi:hypothetical protein